MNPIHFRPHTLLHHLEEEGQSRDNLANDLEERHREPHAFDSMWNTLPSIPNSLNLQVSWGENLAHET